jgi:hypothetical protein
VMSVEGAGVGGKLGRAMMGRWPAAALPLMGDGGGGWETGNAVSGQGVESGNEESVK